MPEITEVPVANPAAELPTEASLAVKATTIVAIVLPLLAVAAVPFAVWGWGFHHVDVWLLKARFPHDPDDHYLATSRLRR